MEVEALLLKRVPSRIICAIKETNTRTANVTHLSKQNNIHWFLIRRICLENQDISARKDQLVIHAHCP